MSTSTLQLGPDSVLPNSQDVFDVVLFNWGTNSGDRYPLALDPATLAQLAASTGFPWSPAAVTLGPLSTVDRAYLSWDSLTTGRAGTSLGPRYGRNSAVVRVVAKDCPVFFPLSAGVTPVSSNQDCLDALQLKTLFAWPKCVMNPQLGLQTTVLPATYATVLGAVNPFFQDGLPPVTGLPQFTTPTLHLQFHRRVPEFAPGSKRMPLVIESAYAGVANNAEQPVAAIPIFGRKSVIVSFSSTLAGQSFRVATLRGLTDNLSVPQETTEGTVVIANAATADKVKITDPTSDYLLLYTTGTGAAYTITFTVMAVD